MRAVCVFAVFLLAGFFLTPPIWPAAAADAASTASSPPPQGEPAIRGCMDRFEQRAAILQGQAIRLVFALRSVHAKDGDALVRARLCYGSSGPVYVLTLLSRNGMVTNVLVDARTGTVLKGH